MLLRCRDEPTEVKRSAAASDQSFPQVQSALRAKMRIWQILERH